VEDNESISGGFMADGTPQHWLQYSVKSKDQIK
jgi:hypothetical protein